MASIDGGYMAVSALITGLLASGMNPEKVAGYAALGFMPVVAKLLDVATVDVLGVSPEAWITMIIMVLAAIVTVTVLET